jgi:hypothetical protein
MKTLKQKSTGKWISLPFYGRGQEIRTHFSDYPEIYPDVSNGSLILIKPELAKNLGIDETDIEILDVSVVENRPYNEEILQKLRAIKQNTIPNFENTHPNNYAMFQMDINQKWDEIFQLIKIIK